MDKKLILSGLTAVLLSACGGSGGDSSSPADNPNQPRPAPSTRDAALTIAARNMETAGLYHTLPKQGSSSSLYHQEIKNSDTHQGGILIFNGKQINYNRLLTSDNSYRYVQFGTFDYDRATGSFVRFDTVIPQLPVQGSAHYRGDSLLDIRGANNRYLRTEIGTVAATADFGAKTLNFEINSPSHQNSISGIKIGKEGSFIKDMAGAIGSGVAGGFAGPNGEEIMGNYTHRASDFSSAIGVFGAKRQ